LYQTSICCKCKEKEESFEHLTTYKVDEARWQEKEFSIVNQIWSNLDTVVRKRMTIENLYTSLTSGKEADRHRKRNYMARGLIDFFQEEIWLQHCNEVAKWEKQIDINPKKKKMKKLNSESSEGKKKEIVWKKV
ncbi:4953_t:CDS:2, partial [Gigaspora margarita]